MMFDKICDICKKDNIPAKTYHINLKDGDNDIDLYGKIDLCEECSEKIKKSYCTYRRLKIYGYKMQS